MKKIKRCLSVLFVFVMMVVLLPDMPTHAAEAELENLALKKEVTVSGLEVNDGRFTAEKAVDGVVSKESRVSFAKDEDEQWMRVDLGAVYTIGEIVINYESAVGKYEIQVSENGIDYVTVYTKNEAQTNGPEVIERIIIDPEKARYIKYIQKERWLQSTSGKQYSGSIYEFEVYEALDTTPKPSEDALIAVEPDSSGAKSASREIGPSKSKLVTVEYNMYTSLEPAETNTAVGLGTAGSNYTSYGEVPVIIRMYSDGYFGAYNGKTKEYVQSEVGFTQNEKYHVRVVANLKNKTYSAYVTGPDKKEKCVAENFGYCAVVPENIGKIYLFNNQQPAGSYWLDKITLTDAYTDTSAVYEKIEQMEKLLNTVNTEEKLNALKTAIDEVKVNADDYTIRDKNLAALDDAYKAFMAKEEGMTRIASFNIAAGKKPDVAKLRKQLEAYDADIVGVQEVDQNTGRNPYDMLEVFEGEVYKNTFFSKAIDYSGGAYGIGTVSKNRLSEGTTVMLESRGNEQRIYQRNLVELAGHQVAFYNTHLSYESTELRHQQMNTLKAAMDADTVEYKIVTGDFNTDQYKEEFAEIFGEDYHIANGMNGIFLDTFNATDDTMKVFCIDNVITSKNIEIKAVQMLENRLSDHNMLFADVIFKEAEPEPTPVDKTALQDALNSAEKLDPNAYTEETWNVLTTVVEEAEAMLENNDVDQTAVDAMTQKILDAIEALEEKPETPVPVDKTALEKAIKDAEARNEKAYTADSWKTMQDALKAAKAVAEDKEATATEVEAARLRLVNAVKDLIKVEEGKPNPNPSDKDKTEGTENTDKAVSTGDSTNLMLWGMILLAACSVVLGIVRTGKMK